MEVKVVILLTNDDGIEAEGLLALKKELSKIGEVWVIAPSGEQSAVSHSLSLHRPLEVRKIGERSYAIDGTPTDGVILGYYGILKNSPDLLVSGINHGPNLGDDVIYSGTVAAAIEGTLLGIPSIAVSVADPNFRYFNPGAKFVKKIALFILEKRLPENTFLNINIPAKKGKNFKYQITKLDKKKKKKVELKRITSRGKTFYWIGKENTTWAKGKYTDYEAIKKGYISITPIKLDLTDYEAIAQVKKWNF